jgi:hypothetical protein
MNCAITLYFLTPYICSITRDQDFVHSPLPLDGVLAHAAYWEALVAGHVDESPIDQKADPAIMADHVTPVLDGVLERVPLSDSDLLGDPAIDEWVYAISSGFPMRERHLYLRHGARWLNWDNDSEELRPDYDVQPIRKRIDATRFSSLNLTRVGKRGTPLTSEPETGKGVLKAIDNRLTTWQIYEYVWFAAVKNKQRLRDLLDILEFQNGVGKKRTAGFGKLLRCDVKPLEESFPDLEVKRSVFVEWEDDLVLLRPLPYDAVMQAPRRVVMTNLIVESGCGYQPPYWSDRRIVVREGTMFQFLS